MCSEGDGRAAGCCSPTENESDSATQRITKIHTSLYHASTGRSTDDSEDVEILREHHPQLLEEFHGVVCDGKPTIRTE